MRSAILFALVLAGCSAGYRDTGVAMRSMAVFDPELFAGRWFEVSGYPEAARRGCTGPEQTVRLTAPGVMALERACLRNGMPDVLRSEAVLSGPGRYRVGSGPGADEYWVLWVDEGYRTAVIGTPSGNGAWILDRDPQIPADRLAAARAVLRFNGYDLGRLELTDAGAT